MKTTILLLTYSLALGFSACQKDASNQTRVLKTLYKTYKNGEISECSYQGKRVYTGSLNAYDAGTVVYDDKGQSIGNCNYAWGQVDSICGQLSECAVVYRVKDNIWGGEAVDTYHLK
ncbi:hypothetical protein GC194_15005 [bacterium]|nr:hypothetical protein [bacterium]